MERVDLLDKGSIELIDVMGGDRRIVDAARVSVVGNKSIREDKALIEYLMDNGHTSPFEHVMFTFGITCPLFVARQWMRHRTWSYNEVSRRYTSAGMEFYTPNVLRLQGGTADKQSSGDGVLREIGELPIEGTLEDYYKYCLALYNSLLEYGVAREQARMVLPQAMYTSFVGTVDLHNLFHFLKLRDSDHAQYEIKVYAEAIKTLIQPHVPMAYSAWERKKEVY